MDIAIIVIGALAFAHFIYEGIVAPSLRMKLRNQMFELRDELRHLHATDDRCTREAFDIAHSGINQYINRLHIVTLSLMSRFKAAYRDKAFREEVERRRKALDACKSSELQSIVSRANHNIEAAFAANSGMWFVYLAPLAMAVLFVTTLTSKLHGLVFRLFATSEARTNALMPDSRLYV